MTWESSYTPFPHIFDYLPSPDDAISLKYVFNLCSPVHPLPCSGWSLVSLLVSLVQPCPLPNYLLLCCLNKLFFSGILDVLGGSPTSVGTVLLDLVPALQDYLISFPPAGAFMYRSEQNTRHGPAPRWSSCSAGGLVTASVHVPDTSFPLRSLSFSSCFFYVFTPRIINVAILL